MMIMYEYAYYYNMTTRHAHQRTDIICIDDTI